MRQFAEKGIIIQQGFGMTETGPTVFIITKEDAVRKAGSVGKPVLHTRRVHHGPRTVPCWGRTRSGELCIRGGNVTTGYWNRPDATAEAIVDGWLHSGDAAMVDDDGFYYIVDRWKDMFISGGENVYPAEIENVIYHHPAVAEVAVIGVPHPKWQEVGRAIVVVKSGHTLTEQEVIEFCQGKLAKYKIPKSVVFVDALPRTAAGKVLKRELREQLRGPGVFGSVDWGLADGTRDRKWTAYESLGVGRQDRPDRRLTLNRPERHNSLVPAFLAEMLATLEAIGANSDVRAVGRTGQWSLLLDRRRRARLL